MKLPRQCAILVGGLGSRLGQLTTDIPKPLLDCGGRPFLAWILRELSRFGIEETVLLAGYKSERIERFCRDIPSLLPKPMSVKVSVEPEPAGTGGAVWYARDLLADTFLLVNGDSWIDTNLARFFAAAAATAASGTLGYVLLRSMEDCSRYGVVERRGRHVIAFHPRPPANTSGMINGGMYIFDRDAIGFMTPSCSLETDVLPVLAAKGLLCGEVTSGYFIDIGVPADYMRGQLELPKRLRRPAVFLDGDEIMKDNYDWLGSRYRNLLTDGTKEAIQLVNDIGLHAFLIGNKASVAQESCTELNLRDIHHLMADDLLAYGCTIDNIRNFSSYSHAMIDKHKQEFPGWSPRARMIVDLVEVWNVVLRGSLLVGGKESDLRAGHAANIPGHLFSGGNLSDFLQTRLFPHRDAN